MALEVFEFQYQNNLLYRTYVDTLYTHKPSLKLAKDIPFLPIQFFKSHSIVSGSFEPELCFESSGTTGANTSRHFVKKAALYETSFFTCFEQFYGSVENWCVIGLLPSYLERKASSLVYMVEAMIKKSKHPKSGFYLYEHEKLAQVLSDLEAKGQPVLLFGVTFGLLDFAEKYQLPLKHTVIMETGGMKGRRTEMTRTQVHEELVAAFQTNAIHSEYGMTELLSQGYSKGDGVFHAAPWMRIAVREEEDPLSVKMNEKASGVINVIDLANLYSCSFIATDDAGRIHPDGSFEVLGRIDHSDVRGCSLMIAE
ncbi:acyl transferase [Paraflavitalea sp. sgz302555]|uniref:LuxE/PaaK family acyltransferase n=1 Tax=Paraflavitalea sp. sgz302555 TaxID=3424849 RepID=UPI003D3544A5